MARKKRRVKSFWYITSYIKFLLGVGRTTFLNFSDDGEWEEQDGWTATF